MPVPIRFCSETSHDLHDLVASTSSTVGAIGISTSGFGHPTCLNTANPATLPKVAQ